MCGLFGIIRFDNTRIDLSQASDAMDMIKHRGPDDEGWLLVNSRNAYARPLAGRDTIQELQLPPLRNEQGSEFDICLGFRRLAILDLGPAGHQPMASPDGSAWVVFNGEIYNYKELRSELEQKGHHFQTRTDTEVLLAAYKEWGTKAATRFIGMFAFCIVDLAQRRLVFGRDAFGIKPLYLARIPGGLLFCSEIRGILAYPDVDRQVEPAALHRYLRFGISDGQESTLLRGIQEFPAAHCSVLPFGEQEHHFEQFWQLDPARDTGIDSASASSQIRDLLEQSVQLHLRSDVPLGTCLSGGLDSTAILMLMKTALGHDYPIDAFSFITDDPVLSEQKYVELACSSARVNLHTVKPTPHEFADDLDSLIRCQEFPFGGPSVYAQHRVFSLAKQSGITVMLDGQGADEILGGYYNFLGAKTTGLLSSLSFGAARRVLSNAPDNMRANFPRMLAFSIGRMLPASLRPFLRPLAGEPMFPSWMQRDWFIDHGVVGTERPSGTGVNALKEEMAIAVRQGSLPELLRYEDRNSMWHSIESRVPFCNPLLADLAFSLHHDHLISPMGVTKVALKEAMRGLVPDLIIDRQKVGFGTPERAWLSAIKPYVQSTLQEGESMGLPYLKGFSREIIRAIEAGGRWPTHAWRIFNLVLWVRQNGVRS